MLRVERGHVGAKGEPDQRARDAAERVQRVGPRRTVTAPEDCCNHADPGCDDRGEPDIRLVDERRERIVVGGAHRTEQAVHDERRQDMTGERRERDHDRPLDGEGRDADERKAEERRQPRPVGDEAARQEEPYLPARHCVRGRGKLSHADPPDPRRHGHATDDRCPSPDSEGICGCGAHRSRVYIFRVCESEGGDRS